VSDEALSRCISLLRAVLADDSREPRLIRTVSRVGYTLLRSPEPLAATAAGAPDPPAAPAPATRTAREAAPLRVGLWGAVGVALIGAAALVWYRSPPAPLLRSAAPPIKRLLVLPFDTRAARDFGRDVGDELADEIADSLAHIESLRITGHTSANALAAAATGALAAGRKLGVDAVLAGTVAESPQGLRVAVQLTATSDGRVLWSRTYARRPADIFAVESSIASAVVRELGGLLSPGALLGVPSVEPDSRDLQAYQLYLRGAHQLRLRGEDSLRRAVDLFSAAARRDPGYARARVGLANAYVLLPSYTFEDPSEMYALAERAIANADRLSHSRSATAGVRAYLGFMRWHWIDAEVAFRTATAADPNNPEVRQMYSQLLGAVGRLDAALAQAQIARELDPLAPVVADRVGILYLWLGRDADAASATALARELGLEEAAYPETGVILDLHQHADAEAVETLRRLQHAVGRPDTWIEPTLSAYRHPEKRPAAVDMLDEARRSGAISARIYFGAMVLLESPGRALAALGTLANRDANDLEFLFSVDAAAVRRDPAFGEFARRAGLEAYWDRFGWPLACHRERAQIRCR
jgi:TolB-like protein